MFRNRILYPLSKVNYRLKKYIKRRNRPYTVIPKSSKNKKNLDDAVVIGGGITGLLAARVLLDHFTHVTLIERDSLSAHPAGRPSTPHAKHARIYHAAGCKFLDTLFLGLIDELCNRGGVLLDAKHDLRWLAPLTPNNITPNSRRVGEQAPLRFLSCTHDLLEWSIRKRLLDHPRLQIVDNVEAIGLLLDKKNHRVVGVTTRVSLPGELSSYSRVELYAELVVDAAGRYSKVPQWLTSLGYEAPTETTVDAQMTFASRIYEIPEQRQADWKALYLDHALPQHGLGCLLLPVEGNCWQVTLSGVGEFAPSGDEMEFIKSLRSLGDSSLYDALINAKPVTPIFVHEVGASFLRHFAQIERYPAGIIVLGDAVCTASILVESGINQAASACILLDRMLSQTTPSSLTRTFAHRYQQQLETLVKQPWQQSIRPLYFHDATANATLAFTTRLMFRYLDRLMDVCTWDQRVHALFLNIHHGLEPNHSLYKPWVVARLARNSLRLQKRQRVATFQGYAIERFV